MKLWSIKSNLLYIPDGSQIAWKLTLAGCVCLHFSKDQSDTNFFLDDAIQGGGRYDVMAFACEQGFLNFQFLQTEKNTEHFPFGSLRTKIGCWLCITYDYSYGSLESFLFFLAHFW